MQGHVVFVGLMGAGKTTVGRLVARQLGRPLRDCDEDVERLTGSTAAQYAGQHGIDALHDREAEVLLAALADDVSLVVTAAASAIENERCRAALVSTFVVWLRAEVPTLVARAATSTHRPLDADAGAQLAEQARRRADLFAAVADLALDVADHPPVALAEAVLARIRP